MITLTYDGTFDGLLTAVFEIYRLKISKAHILDKEVFQENFFDNPIDIQTDKAKAKRVYDGVKKKTDKKAAGMLYRCFLSEQKGIEMLILDFIQKAMDSPQNIARNYGDDTVLKLNQINKKIGREVHRMHAFVRFQKTADDIYFAVIEPDFNVIPLIGDHFKRRYADQEWVIYDSRRHYGIHFDTHKTEFITFPDASHQQFQQLSASILDEKETSYQDLWKNYFDSVNIPERRNMKLHLQHVPRRYWKYLTEKHGINNS